MCVMRTIQVLRYVIWHRIQMRICFSRCTFLLRLFRSRGARAASQAFSLAFERFGGGGCVTPLVPVISIKFTTGLDPVLWSFYLIRCTAQSLQ